MSHGCTLQVKVDTPYSEELSTDEDDEDEELSTDDNELEDELAWMADDIDPEGQELSLEDLFQPTGDTPQELVDLWDSQDAWGSEVRCLAVLVNLVTQHSENERSRVVIFGC